jgi:nucleoside-diphosphate-sugar epimerase
VRRIAGETNEDSPVSQTFVLRDRIRSERHALRLSEEGVRVSALRLPPYVYGRGGSYFVPLLMQKAAELGQSIYVDDGTLRTSAVHVDDAAELYLLAASKAKPGEVFNCTGSTNTSLRQ